VIYRFERLPSGPLGDNVGSRRKMSPTHDAPYRGLRVFDFGQGIASPYCAMLLGVYGAEVIKVEPPEGDWSRYLGTTYGSHTALSAV
jgi:crotonobetainyl-CoA:carnitine CoA-transferase CaiB-like acyl-CoA transferase